MPSQIDIPTWLERARTHWGLLAQCAVWVLSIIGTFVLSPPADVSTDDNEVYLGLAKFVVAVIAGLVIVAASRWHKRKHSTWWAASAVLFLISAIFSFDSYQQRMDNWTCRYDGKRKIVGSILTPQGRSYSDSNPGMSCNDLLLDFAGKSEDIWVKESIDARRISLSRSYLLSITLFTLCLLSIIQAIYCITEKDTSSQPPPAPSVEQATDTT